MSGPIIKTLLKGLSVNRKPLVSALIAALFTSTSAAETLSPVDDLGISLASSLGNMAGSAQQCYLKSESVLPRPIATRVVSEIFEQMKKFTPEDKRLYRIFLSERLAYIKNLPDNVVGDYCKTQNNILVAYLIGIDRGVMKISEKVRDESEVVGANVSSNKADSFKPSFGSKADSGRQFRISINRDTQLQATIEDIVEELPFNKGTEYKGSFVYCPYFVDVELDSDYGLAVKDPFGTVVALVINGSDGSYHSMNLNFGLSLGLLDGEMTGGYVKSTSLISQFSRDFDTREAAAAWVSSGGCDLPSSGELSYLVLRGDVMWQDRDVYEKLNDFVEVSVQ